MNPLKALIDALLTPGLLTAVPFAVATLGQIVPIKAPYTYSPTMVLADLTVSDFDGSTALVQPSVPTTYRDPFTGNLILKMNAPAGGWFWEVTGVTNLPQSVYGYALLNAAGTVLYAVTPQLVTPIPLTGVAQGVTQGDMGFIISGAGLLPFQD